MEDPGEHVAARRAPRTHGDAALEGRLLQQAVGHPAAGELIAAQAGAATGLQYRLAVALHAVGECDEVVVPAHQLATRVERAAQEVEAARAKVVVTQVVLARPSELDGRGYSLSDSRGLDDVVRTQAPAEAAPGASQVQRDLSLRHAQCGGHQVLSGSRVLRGRPDLEPAVAEPRRAVLGFDAGVRDERVAVSRLHGLRGAGKGRRGIAVLAQHVRARLLGHRGRLGDEALPALRIHHPFVPVDLELPARAERHPGGFRDDGHTRHQAVEVAGALDDKRVAHARQGLDRFKVGADYLAAERRTLFEHRVEHARQLHVDAEERLAGDDGGVVHAAHPRAQQFVVLGILQDHAGGVGNRQRAGRCYQRAIAEAALARAVQHGAGTGHAFVGRHVPGQGRRLNQQGACGGAQAMKVVVVVGRRSGAPRALAAVGRVQIALDDAHVLPIDFQLFGDDHGQGRLDALADFRLLGDERDHAAGRDPDEGVGMEVNVGQAGGLAHHIGSGEWAQVDAQQKARAPLRGTAQEAASTSVSRQDAGWPGRVHADPLAFSREISAARWMPARMRRYVPQRQRLPAIAPSMSASLGCGLSFSSAAAVMIWPAWQ